MKRHADSGESNISAFSVYSTAEKVPKISHSTFDKLNSDISIWNQSSEWMPLSEEYAGREYDSLQRTSFTAENFQSDISWGTETMPETCLQENVLLQSGNAAVNMSLSETSENYDQSTFPRFQISSHQRGKWTSTEHFFPLNSFPLSDVNERFGIGQQCAECAAGKPGHIQHIGRSQAQDASERMVED